MHLSYGKANHVRAGTTVSAMLCTKEWYCLVQIGDSRIYLDDGAATRLLTRDQTLAMREFLAGNTTAEEFAVDPRQRYLLQCVGDGRVTPVFQKGNMPRHGAFLLCSDGFYKTLRAEHIRMALGGETQRSELQRRVLALGSYARTQGERDNMTAVVLRWDEFAEEQSNTERMPGESVCADETVERLVEICCVNAEPLV